MHVPLPRLYHLALICLIGTLALPGCGFGGGASDRDQISDVVSKAFTEDDPKLCGEVLSANFIKTFYGTVARCEQNAAKGGNADSVDVLRLTVTGDSATALIMASGGSASPKPVTLKLVNEDGDWKIDGVAG